MTYSDLTAANCGSRRPVWPRWEPPGSVTASMR